MTSDGADQPTAADTGTPPRGRLTLAGLVAVAIIGSVFAGHALYVHAAADQAAADVEGEPALEGLPPVGSQPVQADQGGDGDGDGDGDGVEDEPRPLDEDEPIEAALADEPPVVEPIVAAAERQDVEPELLLSLAWHESRFDPQAESSAGAVGVLQVMPQTADRMAEELDEPIDPREPGDNALVAATYLAILLEEHDSAEEALIAYNQGPVALAEDGPYPPAQEFADTVLETRDRLRDVEW